MTYRNSRRQEVLDAFRAHVERFASAPSCRQLGAATGMSAVGAWKHLRDLKADGLIEDPESARRGRPPKALKLADDVNLGVIQTDKLRGELARRGVTMDALEVPQLLRDEGRPCAADFCEQRVGRGHLMCRKHWFELPIQLRRAITNAFGARRPQAYQEAVEAARDYLGGFTRVVERVQ